MLTLQLCVILACLLLGTRYGGMGLGLISGIGFFNVQPGKPPIDVILTILAVIGCAATLQTAGGLDVLNQWLQPINIQPMAITQVK